MNREDLAVLHRANVRAVNARLLTDGRCFMHNSDVRIPPTNVVRYANGNEVPVCDPCWQGVLGLDSDPADRPVSFWPIGIGQKADT